MSSTADRDRSWEGIVKSKTRSSSDGRSMNHCLIVILANGDRVQALVQNTGQELTYKQGDPVRVYMPSEALRVLTDTGTAPIDEDALPPVSSVA